MSQKKPSFDNGRDRNACVAHQGNAAGSSLLQWRACCIIHAAAEETWRVMVAVAASSLLRATLLSTRPGESQSRWQWRHRSIEPVAQQTCCGRRCVVAAASSLLRAKLHALRSQQDAQRYCGGGGGIEPVARHAVANKRRVAAMAAALIEPGARHAVVNELDVRSRSGSDEMRTVTVVAAASSLMHATLLSTS